MNGVGVLEDKADAVLWYRKPALRGNPVLDDRPRSLYARRRWSGENAAEAASWLQRAADAGCSRGMLPWGMARDQDTDMPENKAKAVLSCRKYASTRRLTARRAGIATGEGGTELFKRAAKAGDGMAMVDLGDALIKDEGVPKTRRVL
jgi:TPR repeat protein